MSEDHKRQLEQQLWNIANSLCGKMDACEFYTPRQVSKILARIVTAGKQRIKSGYDSTEGSKSLLLRLSREREVLNFYGQERKLPISHNF